ncbi:four helix bundle protein [Alsobacter sp. SYSU BS001988]|jgi:four helix bundle protein
MDLAQASYLFTATFPKSEMYGLTSQIRRSATSVAANIAEGHGREHTGSFVQSLRIAQGSLKEFETHVLLAGRVKLAADKEVDALMSSADDLGRKLRALIRSLQRRMETQG